LQVVVTNDGNNWKASAPLLNVSAFGQNGLEAVAGLRLIASRALANIFGYDYMDPSRLPTVVTGPNGWDQTPAG
jgi:hypothetical protein